MRRNICITGQVEHLVKYELGVDKLKLTSVENW